MWGKCEISLSDSFIPLCSCGWTLNYRLAIVYSENSENNFTLLPSFHHWYQTIRPFANEQFSLWYLWNTTFLCSVETSWPWLDGRTFFNFTRLPVCHASPTENMRKLFHWFPSPSWRIPILWILAQLHVSLNVTNKSYFTHYFVYFCLFSVRFSQLKLTYFY